jgi:6-phosphogluconolactonase
MDGLELIGTVGSGGPAPKSVAYRDGLVYVLNTGKPSVSGFRLTEMGLEPIPGAEQTLSAANAEGAQVGFSPDGSTLVVTERATDSVITFAVGGDGRLGEMRVSHSSGPTPYGFAFTSTGTLVVTEAFRATKGEAAASTHILRDGVLTPVTKSLHNGRSEICWAVVTPDDRYAFTTNFADGAVSRYAIGMDGSLTLEDATAGLTEDGRPGLRDEGLSVDGRFLYAIDADAGSIVGWGVGDGGSLTPIGTWGGLPRTVAGLAAR